MKRLLFVLVLLWGGGAAGWWYYHDAGTRRVTPLRTRAPCVVQRTSQV